MNEATSMENSTIRNETDGFPKYPLSISALILSVELVVAVLGILGNILVCLVITKRANMKTSMNLYLRNLAITDLGVLILIFPLSADLARSAKGWPFGRFVCLYIYPGLDTFFGASIWSMTVIAIERHKNIISRKTFVKKVESFKRVTIKIVLIWLVSFAVVAIPLYPVYVYRHENNLDACYPEWPAFMNNFMFKAYGVCLAVFWYVLPLGIITITYWKISTQLRQSITFHKIMQGDRNTRNGTKILREEERKRFKQNKKAQRILTPLVVTFAVMMLPMNVFRLVQGFVPDFNQMQHYFLLLDLCVLSIVMNSAIDAVVYYLCGKEFRVGIKALFSRKGVNFKGSRDTKILKGDNPIANNRKLRSAHRL